MLNFEREVAITIRFLLTVFFVFTCVMYSHASPPRGSAVAVAPPSDALQTQLAGMAVRSWAAIPSSDFHSAEYAVDTTCQHYRLGPGSCDYVAALATAINGGTGPNANFYTWGGGAWNSDDRCLVVWSGGHVDYFGAEVYEFCGSNAKWVRLDTPHSDAPYPSCPTTNVFNSAAPYEAHTYDSLTYYNHYFYNFWRGGVGFGPGPTYGECNNPNTPFDVDRYNVSTQTWNNQSTGNSYVIASTPIAAFDSANPGTLYLLDHPGSNSVTLWKSTDLGVTWISLGFTTGAQFGRDHSSGDIQPGAGFFRIGYDNSTPVMEFPFNGGNAINVTTSGDATCITNAQNYTGPNSQGAPGFSWYITDSAFVSPMPGSLNICELNPSTGVWSQITMTGSTPPVENSSSQGVLGRFRVVTNYNNSGMDMAILAIDTSLNLYIARLK